MPCSETEIFILEDFFRSVLSQFKKYHPSGNLKFNNLRIFQSLKLRNLIGKILRISLKLNFNPNTLFCFGLRSLILAISQKKISSEIPSFELILLRLRVGDFLIFYLSGVSLEVFKI